MLKERFAMICFFLFVFFCKKVFADTMEEAYDKMTCYCESNDKEKTKSIADAQEAYVTATMDAKTSKIRANNEAEKHLLDGSKNAASKVNLLHILCCGPSLLPSASLLSLTWLVCCQRKGQRKAKKAAKKGKGKRESEAADQGADEV